MVLIVRLDDVSGHQAVALAGDQQERRSLMVREVSQAPCTNTMVLFIVIPPLSVSITAQTAPRRRLLDEISSCIWMGDHGRVRRLNLNDLGVGALGP